MKKPSYLFFILAAISFSNAALARLNVFACEPEWGSLATELGGDKVEIYTATTAFQDPHRIEARPSLIARTRNADLVVCSGADLEVGWLPLLLRSSANKKVQPGQPGYFEAAQQVERLDIPERVDRAMGDVHAQGNPHVHLDPRRVVVIASALTKRLVEIDPANTSYYQQRGEDFHARWQTAMTRWNTKAAPLKGQRIVVHHKDWVYLFDWLGIEKAAALEPKPGVAPGAGHLADVLSSLKSNPAKLVIHTSYQVGKASSWLSTRANIKAVQLPYTVGGSDNATDLFSLLEETLDLLLEGIR
ncbi:MAG: zinc ABC transporter substrate-binding protein [Gammaproteobacteria bacterium]|nr:zinc ABC transporter substrate-binding protein [Gammaproteobacteria bacterium]